MKRILAIFLAASVPLCPLSAVNANDTDYATLEVKATRFFKYEEWASALAMYELMMRQHPERPELYTKSIVTSGLMKDEPLQISFMEEAQKHAIPFDSIFDGVRNEAVSLSRPTIYTDFMSLVKQRQPWMKRAIDVKLLEFAVFRGNDDGTIELAESLLQLSPDNIDFLSALGNAYLRKGQYPEAIATLQKVLKIQPDDIQSLLMIGNYYVMKINDILSQGGLSLGNIQSSSKQKIILSENDIATLRNDCNSALEYLNKANALKTTPYLRSTITNVSKALQITE